MGCTQSKIENEELVARCKERKQLMKSAVKSRHAFAAAHSAYAMALKNTGAALSDYAQGEVHDLHVASAVSSSSTAAGQTTFPSSSVAVAIGTGASVVHPPQDNLPPPPPPPDHLTTVAPLQRAASMPGLPISSVRRNKSANESEIIEEDDTEATVDDSEVDAVDDSYAAPATPPAPPAPPAPPKPSENKSQLQQPAPEENWDFFGIFKTENIPAPSLGQPEESMLNKESEKFAQTESSPAAAIKDPTPPVPATVIPEKIVAEPPPNQQQKIARKQRQSGGSSHHHRTGSSGGGESKRGKMVPAVPHVVSFLQILKDLDDHFLKAYESAKEVSKMLEATRLHYHSNFADNSGHIDHSDKVLKVITWNRSIKGIPTEADANDDLDDEKWDTHATVLDKMLAWEKKLYEEVKDGELMKFEYQRKLYLLNKKKKRGVESESLEKLKASVSQLHTRYIVDMQSMDSTVSEINSLRDQKLYPRLVELVDGMCTMWEAMHVHHSNQHKLVLGLRACEIALAPRETSEQHHETTIQLWQIVREWHSQFQNFITHQKDYIKALNSWLKLNLIPIESSLKEKTSLSDQVKPPIQNLLQAWHDQLQKLPDGFAKSAIYSFSEVINTIVIHQEDELKLKERCEETRKEFFRKKRNFEDWHRKYIEKRAGQASGDEANQKELLEERKFAVESVEVKLKSEEETYQRTCKEVREKSVGSLRNKLPELFHALSDFSLACSEMYKQLQTRTQSEKPVAAG